VEINGISGQYWRSFSPLRFQLGGLCVQAIQGQDRDVRKGEKNSTAFN
jgi:hypothetical protein